MFGFNKKKNKEVTSITIMVNGQDENGNNISVSNHNLKSLNDAHNFLAGVEVMWDLPDQLPEEEIN